MSQLHCTTSSSLLLAVVYFYTTTEDKYLENLTRFQLCSLLSGSKKCLTTFLFTDMREGCCCCYFAGTSTSVAGNLLVLLLLLLVLLCSTRGTPGTNCWQYGEGLEECKSDNAASPHLFFLQQQIPYDCDDGDDDHDVDDEDHDPCCTE